MKTRQEQNIRLGFLTFFVIGILFISCDDNNLGIDDTITLDETSAKTQTEIDDVSESVDAIIEDIYFNETNPTAAKSDNTESKFLPDCVTITKVITKGTKEVTIDYGDGCTTKNDNVLKGKIFVTFKFNISELSVDIDYTFEDFYFNDKKIEGTVHKARIKINDSGNPQATINRDIKIIWEDGTFVSVKGERTREWVEGFGNKVWGDNVFLITGKWTITNKDGEIKIATIIEPLRREMSCRFIVSGITEIEIGDKKITLNYGDGTCDDIAIATVNGEEHEIHLSKRRK